MSRICPCPAWDSGFPATLRLGIGSCTGPLWYLCCGIGLVAQAQSAVSAGGLLLFNERQDVCFGGLWTVCRPKATTIWHSLHMSCCSRNPMSCPPGQYGMALPLLNPSSPQAYTTQLPSYQVNPASPGAFISSAFLAKMRHNLDTHIYIYIYIRSTFSYGIHTVHICCTYCTVITYHCISNLAQYASKMGFEYAWMLAENLMAKCVPGSNIFTTTLPSAYTGAVPASSGSVRISSPMPVQTAAWWHS